MCLFCYCLTPRQPLTQLTIASSLQGYVPLWAALAAKSLIGLSPVKLSYPVCVCWSWIKPICSAMWSAAGFCSGSSSVYSVYTPSKHRYLSVWSFMSFLCKWFPASQIKCSFWLSSSCLLSGRLYWRCHWMDGWNNLREVCQSAYRKNHSTETLLLCVTDSLLCKADNRQVSFLTLLDQTAAFDTISCSTGCHTLLVSVALCSSGSYLILPTEHSLFLWET